MSFYSNCFLNQVVGQVGAGKSSLLAALLGEMHHLNETGSMRMDGRVAYVPQQAWIQNATVRSNILFGKTYDKQKYDRVVDACTMRVDFDIMSHGDLTEIGDKGISSIRSNRFHHFHIFLQLVS